MAHRIGWHLAAILLHTVVVAAADTSPTAPLRPLATHRASAGRALPVTVSVPADLRRHVESMLAMSTTFRAQCRRIAEAPSVRVVIRIDPGLVERNYRARTSIARTPSGEIFARVHVSLWLNPVEWIAHEFEHVIEQLDGLDLPALAAGHKGVWLSTDKMFETMRAIAAGRAVAAEMQRARRRPWRDKFVE
jgi:hypothetical protein